MLVKIFYIQPLHITFLSLSQQIMQLLQKCSKRMMYIIVLFAGIGGRKNLLESYMRQGSRVRGNSQVCIPFDASSNVSDLLFTTTVSPEEACINGTKVLFFGNHRDMTIKVEYLNFCLRHRFTGHHLVQSNDGGLATFFEPSFQNELNELFDNPCQDGKPDFLVINSGLHDFPPKINRTREEYEKQLRDLAVILVGLQNRGTKVIWKGNYGPWSIVRNSWTNTIPQEIMNASNITYADCESVLSHLLYYHDIDMFSEDHIHFGAISFYIAENHSMLVSSMIIQKVIGEIISNISSGGE